MNKLQTLKKFAVNNKTAIAVGVTVALCIGINRLALKQHNDFLKAHDLFDEFYAQ